MNLILIIISALGAFIVTNIDDIFILMMLFSMARSQAKTSNSQTVNMGSKRINSRDIVIGQYLGFALLVLISLLATFGITLLAERWIGLLGLIPMYLGVKLFIKGEDDDDDDNILSRLNKFNKFYLSVAFITFANGGDNIGIYIPVFSTLETNQLIITVVTFLIMVAIWCLLGYRLARFRFVSETLEKYGRWIIPIVFIGLGIYIMLENELFTSLINLFK
ncbi:MULTISPECIES: CadD family cadmium resistance transporter [Calidifontibacillus/Schinkia group]|uniref:CadD family cadmium resistance transporter n=1 Tax=Calidifontibacillus/Schinkia group TaxID=2906525 RepID=UPI0002E22E7E|nr:MULTISPECIES: CadD family cadmium resistance transporter [Calidifontibacillus/Schinkia group]MEC1743011.1 CadD family cadmium resistance transporter [Schinkia azotoformans]MEC1769455.1 CadD family cadmium resistance transporter [Schinkia azotoformans]MEC1788649.1 CadD family cadmium resistance transporter [Schinkia azotoformans]MED4377321.1 CadD family cadmium resistance transporter [Schinkia azotoformans]MED4420158.1 CadD family cadmium resistance transporter [Schinkia azotoformans]